jgi:hypothetical protein
MFRNTFRHTVNIAGRFGRRGIATSARNSRPLSGKFLVAGGISAITGVYMFGQQIQLDNSKEIAESVAVDSSISPFPITIRQSEQKNLHHDYQMLGHGVRAVTFLGFKVYGIGMYISQADVAKVRSVLKDDKFLAQFGTENHTLEELLHHGEYSSEIVEKLLDSGVQFMVRLSPVRNTDFGHLKDGLIKTILAHGRSKEQRETVGKGLEELRTVFGGHKGSVPKDHLMYLEILKGGEMGVSYENTKTHKITEMGKVTEPLVSKLLFLQYLSGKKPLSESLRKTSVEGLIRLTL